MPDFNDPFERCVPEYIARLVPYRPGKPVAELERELGIQNAVKLASNENPLGPSPHALEALAAARGELHRYPDAATWALRRALAEHHDVPMDEIVPGHGSNELIDLICRTFAGPSDHAVIGLPSFVCYHLGLTAANVPFSAVPLDDHLRWNVEALLAAVEPRTKLLFLANPNNPTGAYVGRAALERLLRALPAHVTAVVDEAYVEFVDRDDYVSALTLRSLRERLIVLRTFSKAYGLAGLRVGYAVGPAPLVGYLHRTRAPFNVGSLGQVAAIAALKDQDHVHRYVEMNQKERARVESSLTALGCEVSPSQANFVFASLGPSSAAAYEALLRDGVIVRPMPAPVDAWVRITVGLPEENDRLLRSVSALREG